MEVHITQSKEISSSCRRRGVRLQSGASLFNTRAFWMITFGSTQWRKVKTNASKPKRSASFCRTRRGTRVCRAGQLLPAACNGEDDGGFLTNIGRQDLTNIDNSCFNSQHPPKCGMVSDTKTGSYSLANNYLGRILQKFLICISALTIVTL